LGPFKTVHQRPEAALGRAEAGHWEGDLITGTRNQSAVITLVDRSTRFTILGHLPIDHTALEVGRVLLEIFAEVPPTVRRTLTWDRGSEMAEWPALEEKTSLNVYFCDPRSPWQRPTNENTNRQLRYWLPKKEDLKRYSKTDLNQIAEVLNSHPRRTLSWETPAERYAAAAVH
jgi:IS30 family transposase